MKKKKKIFNKIIDFLIFIITIMLIAIPVIGGAFMYFNAPFYDNKYIITENDGIRQREDGDIYLEVRRGETARSVGLRLERTKLIKNKYFWNLLGRLEKEHIKSGTYKLEMPLTQIEIYRILVSGKQTLHRVTIPEGSTLRRMAARFEDEDICSVDDFLDAARNMDIINEYNIPARSMEGYLFPDTYFFPSEYPAEQVVRSMADNFFKRMENIDPAIKELTPRQLYEKVIIASIVEREYRIPEEAAIMAGVFYNRMRINMGLQSCATVEYVITDILGLPHPGFISGADLEIDNRYNTYRWAGLPPGPISSPGMISLRASFFPEETDFFYFRLENANSGRHIFSRTNEEHINAGRITKPQSR
ncbi:MAG: endolytic transglycosylase MltG [Treponema sp.]|jgi:UPF0755 protein|nr:endolytic transglycosylase MltG [Treponema sp.]